jgi:hypothetical protein
MKLKHGLVLGAVLGLTATQMALADPTAFDLARKGDDYIGVQSKGKLLEIYSEKSVAMLTPNIWYVDYYDPDAGWKTVEVKFGGGQEMEVTHPSHVFQGHPKATDVLDWSKLNIDSTRALRIAAEQPLLKGLTLKESKMTLQNSDDGVVWKVELWVAKVNDSTKEGDVGTVTLSPDSGSVIKADLHPDNAN